LFHAYGERERGREREGERERALTKLIIAAHNFANAPKTASIDIVCVLT